MPRILGRILLMTALVGIAGTAAALGQAGEDGTIRLSLADAVARALERNLDIAVARLDPVSAREDVTVADSVFDSDLTFNVSNTDTTSEPTSIFSVQSQTSRLASAEFTDPSRGGGALNASFSHSQTEATFPPGAEGFFRLIPENFTTSVSLSYRQPLLRNFGLSINKTQVEQARNNLAISEHQFQDRINQLVQDVESAYWDLVGALRQLEVSRESLSLAEDFLDQTKVKVDVGTLPPIEITTAEAEVASREEDVIVTENSVGDAEDRLRALLRFAESSPDWFRPILPSDDPGFQQVDVDLEGAIEKALERRSIVLEAALALTNAELTERFQRNQRKPDLSLSSTFSVTGNSFETVPVASIAPGGTVFFDENGFLYQQGDPRLTAPDSISVTLEQELLGRGASFSELVDSDNTDFTVAMNLTIPIKNRRAKAEHARSKIAIEQARLRLDSARQTVRVEVRQSVREVETTARRVASARVNVELQRRKLDAEEKRYENGLSTAFQVLEFQNDLQQAGSREIAAIIDYNKALARLARVQGILIGERNIRIR
ncbi:MAG: TolC family protein [Acidobacteriota bacterium]|nr:TolC family protein [Acidobacteriota bacterium]